MLGIGDRLLCCRAQIQRAARVAPLTVVAMGVFAAIPWASWAAPLFATALSYSVGHGPTCVAIADLNADGRPDLAIANYEPGSVTVWFGSGNGAFGPRTDDFATGFHLFSLAIADLNADARPDLAAASGGSDAVSVQLGNGDGTFGGRTDFGTGLLPQSVAIADLNADGRPDLLVANYNTTVSVLLGNGDGTFRPQTEISTGINPRSGVIADLNADGRPDLAVANLGSNTVSVLLGNGDGTFRAKTDFDAGNWPISVAIADLNADGRPDLVVANWLGNTVSVLLGNGDGTFRAQREFSTGSNPTSVAIANLDGDGWPDLAAANEYSNTVSVLLGNGDGTFGAKTDFGTGNHPTSVAIADLNADGLPDLAVANIVSNTVSVLFNTGGVPTPTTLSLVDASADPRHAELSWYGATMAGRPATVYRQAEGTAWTAVASIMADGTGRFRYEDVNVRPGARYGYRLGIQAGGSEEYFGETSIAVPIDWLLALASPAPNPATDRLAIAFTLPSAAPARLEVVDVAGRMVGLRDAGSLEAGQHLVTFTEAAQWRPGIYLVRLTQGPRSITARACIVH